MSVKLTGRRRSDIQFNPMQSITAIAPPHQPTHRCARPTASLTCRFSPGSACSLSRHLRTSSRACCAIILPEACCDVVRLSSARERESARVGEGPVASLFYKWVAGGLT